MKSSHGLLGEVVTFITLFCTLASTLPRNAYAEEVEEKSPYDIADELNQPQVKAGNKPLEFLEPKTYFGSLTEAAGKIYDDPNLFYPTLIGSIIPTGWWYWHRYQRYAEAARAHVDALKLHDAHFSQELSQLSEQRQVVAKRFEELLAQAKKADYKAVMKRLPPDVAAPIIKAFDEKGIKFPTKDAATSIDDLVNTLDDLHGLDLRQYELMKKLGPELEKRLKLSPGSITRQLRNPEVFMKQGFGIATKTANPRAVAAEMTRYETAVAREIGKARALGKLPKVTTEMPWWPSRRTGGPFWSRHYLDNKSYVYTRRFLGRAWRFTAPALIGIGSGFLAMTIAYQAFGETEKAKRANENLDVTLDRKEAEIYLKALPLMEDSLILMVQVLWQDLRDRYGEKGFIMDCPYKLNDPAAREMIALSYQTVMTDFMGKKTDIYLKDDEDDKIADDKMKALAQKLEISLPPLDRQFSVRFYRALWMDLLAKADNMQGGNLLTNIPAERSLVEEREIGPQTRPVVTRSELVSDLAINSSTALLRILAIFKKDKDLAERLLKYDDEKRTKLLTALKEIDPDLAKIFEGIIQRHEILKKSAEREEKDPLPLDEEVKAEKKAAEATPAAVPEEKKN